MRIAMYIIHAMAVFVCFYFVMIEWAWFNCSNISGKYIRALYTLCHMHVCVLILQCVLH